MNYAPIIIPTLNRVDHLTKLLDSLRRNSLAQYTDVFIGLDYPPSSLYEEGYERMCKYLQNDFSCFNSFNIIKRSENFGYLRNVEDLIDQVLQLHDRFIYMDDDLELSPNFLEYMNKCLTEYEGRDEIIAVCGYSYPLSWVMTDQSNVIRENFNCSMWGTGFWKSKYYNMQKSLKAGGLLNYTSLKVNGNFNRLIDLAKYEYLNLCLFENPRRYLVENITDISIRLYLAMKGKFVIIPTLSKVRNCGFDGSGVYCPQIVRQKGRLTASNYDYRIQEIDCETSFTLIEDTMNNVVANRRILNRFDVLPLKYKVRLYVKLVLLKFLGVRNYVKLFS